MAVLRPLLDKYGAGRLGDRTWVLVKSDDWKALQRQHQMDPDSPAFTVLDRRETFFEEALGEFGHDETRGACQAMVAGNGMAFLTWPSRTNSDMRSATKRVKRRPMLMGKDCAQDRPLFADSRVAHVA
jgi:hypothetical protein